MSVLVSLNSNVNYYSMFTMVIPLRHWQIWQMWDSAKHYMHVLEMEGGENILLGMFLNQTLAGIV